mmetsp:Transcript_42068/g.76917  ORF Transcript_42068/g.76917 Transcript_42068/m.76917 type:complete len:302 (+) Transcript_42068:304-1209(+)
MTLHSHSARCCRRRLIKPQPGRNHNIPITLILIQLHKVPSFELQHLKEYSRGGTTGTSGRKLVVAELRGLFHLFLIQLVGVAGLHVALEHAVYADRVLVPLGRVGHQLVSQSLTGIISILIVLATNVVKLLLEIVDCPQRKARPIRLHADLILLLFHKIVILVLHRAKLILDIKGGFHLLILLFFIFTEINVVITPTEFDIGNVHVVSVHAILLLLGSYLFHTLHILLLLFLGFVDSFFLHELFGNSTALLLPTFSTHAEWQLRAGLAGNLAHVATPQRKQFGSQSSVVTDTRTRQQTLRG